MQGTWNLRPRQVLPPLHPHHLQFALLFFPSCGLTAVALVPEIIVEKRQTVDSRGDPCLCAGPVRGAALFQRKRAEV